MMAGHERGRGAPWMLHANVAITVVMGVVLLAAGRVGDSSTLVAEGWHTLGDGVLGMLSAYSAMLSARGADAEHPYGRGKYEHLAGAVMGGVLIVLAAEMTLDFVGHAASGHAHQPAFSSSGIVMLLALAAARCAWALTLFAAARRTASVALSVEARHVRVDAFVTCAAIGAALGGQWSPWCDVVGGLAVIVVVGLTGISLLKEHAPWLADRAVVPPDVIERALAELCCAASIRRTRSRGTPEQAFAEVVVDAHESLSLGEASAMARAIERRVLAACPEVTEVLVVVEGTTGMLRSCPRDAERCPVSTSTGRRE